MAGFVENETTIFEGDGEFNVQVAVIRPLQDQELITSIFLNLNSFDGTAGKLK